MLAAGYGRSELSSNDHVDPRPLVNRAGSGLSEKALSNPPPSAVRGRVGPWKPGVIQFVRTRIILNDYGRYLSTATVRTRVGKLLNGP